ncbi:cytochrome P450 71B10-like isoform X2 [Diospyros lotus]|uniref:cytochrome P450 71B10-like isoform X2 n=1 Tax=Diospyros lotus TaxID=55363 RepID=UPI0022528116|nr:cytochrome P450 71B10-like isoform X2 [Diospyros lotus]
MGFSSFSSTFLPWLLTLILLALSFTLCKFFLLKQSKKSAKFPPGPRKLPIIGNLHQLGEIPHYSLWKLSHKYGPIMLLQLGRVPTLVVSTPELAKQVLRTHDLDCCTRPLSRGQRKLKVDKTFRNLDAFFEAALEAHLDPAWRPKQHEDIIDVMLGLAKDRTTVIHLTKDHMKAILLDIFLGSVDTSSVTIIWAMAELSKNPRAMKKAQAQIRSCIGRKPKVDEAELDKLTYLKLVVKETFRLHPPASLLLPRETIRQCQIGGYSINPKTRILVNAWAIGRDPKIWTDPEEFIPERFENSPIDFKGHNFELLPFGSGRRMCPGINMATVSVEFTLANLLHCFNWKLPDGMKEEELSMEEEFGLNIRKKVPLLLVPVNYNWQEDYAG